MKILMLVLGLLFSASAFADRSPQGYWNINPSSCGASSTVRWDDNSTGYALVTITSKQGKWYIVVAATNRKWGRLTSWVNIAEVKFSPSNVTFLTEVRGIPASAGSEPMVVVMVEATPTHMQLLRSSSKLVVNDGTGALTLPLIRVGDAFDGINACIN